MGAILGVSIIQGALWVTAVATALVTTAAAVEKVFSPIGKWLQHWLASPLAAEIRTVSREVNRVGDRMEILSDEQASMRAELAELRHLTRYHLGENGGTTPVHRRIERLEQFQGIEDDQ